MKKFSVLIIFILLLSQAACGGNPGVKEVSDYRLAFGTIMTIRLYGSDEALLRDAIEEGFSLVEEMEGVFSSHKEDSELSKINRDALSGAVSASPDFLSVLKEAAYYSNLSGGTFDPSIGRIIELWAVGTEDARLPATDELIPLMNMGVMSLVSVEDDKVSFLDDRIKLDFGAIAKGYAADRVRERFEELLSESPGFSYGVLDFGGNIVLFGEKSDKSPFVVGIVDPKNPSEPYGYVSIPGGSVVTSGSYERFFEWEGKTYHHIMDPKTAAPAESGLLSVTVVGEDSSVCDALSTACFILGKEQGMHLIDLVSGAEAVFIDEDGECFLSSGMDAYGFERAKKQ